MGMFSMSVTNESKHKLAGMKVCEVKDGKRIIKS